MTPQKEAFFKDFSAIMAAKGLSLLSYWKSKEKKWLAL